MCSEGMKSYIKNLVVLSPQYLVDVMTDIHDAPKRLAMKRQFSRELKKMQKEGVVGSRLLEHVGGEAEKPTEVLIELLGHFNLLYPLYAANENEDKQGNPQLSISSPSHSPSSFSSHNLEYIIPCLLKGKHGESLEKHWDKISERWKEKSDEDHVFVLDFGRFLPSALFDYLLVHIYRQSQNTKGMKPVLRRSEGIFSFSNKFLFRIKLVLKDSQIWIYARLVSKNDLTYLVQFFGVYLPVHFYSVLPYFLPSFLISFVPFFAASFLISFVPFFAASFLISFLPSFLISFLPYFLISFLISFLPSLFPYFLPSFLPYFFPSYLPSFLPSSLISFLLHSLLLYFQFSLLVSFPFSFVLFSFSDFPF